MEQSKLSNKNDMAQLILDAATKLFYEQGVSQTSMKQIASLCDTCKSHISYYYKNKMNLASEVLSNYTKKIKNAVGIKMFVKYKEYNLQLATAIETRLTLRMYRDDDKAFCFYRDVAPFTFEAKEGHGTLFFDLHDRYYNLPIDHEKDELAMLAYASKGAVTALILTYFKGLIKTPYDEFEDYRVAILYRFMRIDENRIDEILEDSKRMVEELDFQFKPYFEIE